MKQLFWKLLLLKTATLKILQTGKAEKTWHWLFLNFFLFKKRKTSKSCLHNSLKSLWRKTCRRAATGLRDQIVTWPCARKWSIRLIPQQHALRDSVSSPDAVCTALLALLWRAKLATGEGWQRSCGSVPTWPQPLRLVDWINCRRGRDFSCCSPEEEILVKK